MNFGKLGDMAKQFTGGDKPKDAANKPKTEGSGNKWADVGSSAKNALAGFNKSKTTGKAPDYKELGAVVQKAATAYKSEPGAKPDLTTIGKGIAAGLTGSAAKQGETPLPADQQAAVVPPAENAAPAIAPAADVPHTEPQAAPLSVAPQATPQVETREEVKPEEGINKPAGNNLADQASSFLSKGLKGFGK